MKAEEKDLSTNAKEIRGRRTKKSFYSSSVIGNVWFTNTPHINPFKEIFSKKQNSHT